MTVEQKLKVLFACEGNTCRSVLAEYISRAKFGDVLEPESAGFKPQPAADAGNAIYTLKSFLNINALGHCPRDIRRLDANSFDFVVAMDSFIAKKFSTLFPAFPTERLIKWKIDDPWGDNLAEYRGCAHAIFEALKKSPLVKKTTPSETTA